MRIDLPSARAAFTLLELLIVVAIIATISGMLLMGVTSIREKARMLSTQTRMQNVLNGLSIYGSSEGSPAFALQTHCALGGVRTFASIKVVLDSIAAGCAKPPGFTQVTDTGAKQTFDSTNYVVAGNPERLSLWRRLIEEVFDVMPPSGATWALSDYQSPAIGGWPAQWPETDWDAATPGAIPPILRFPWGKEGLRIDGSLCDPNADTSTTTMKYTEGTTYAGSHYAVNEVIYNRWATTGDEAGSARLWKWTSTDATQTDSVVLDSAKRSDGTAVALSATSNTNKPLPFDMGWMSPLASIPLLQAAGVLSSDVSGEDDYRNNRKPSAAWNDAWGHPLVVVYALYQPERYTRMFDDADRRDLMLKAAARAYQYDRSVYLAVTAVGPDKPPALPSTWAATADAATLRDYWLQLRDVTQAVDWTEASFSAPPWKGVRVNKRNGYKSLVTAPTELK